MSLIQARFGEDTYPIGRFLFSRGTTVWPHGSGGIVQGAVDPSGPAFGAPFLRHPFYFPRESASSSRDEDAESSALLQKTAPFRAYSERR
jgi:hypothetical protein